MKAGVQSLAKAEVFAEATQATSGALPLETESFSQVLKAEMRGYYFVRNTSVHELEDLRELETSSGLLQNVILVLTDPRCSNHSARG